MLDYSIGKRCQFSICKQQDFLPFTCQLCNGAFCTEHRTPEAHECNRLAIKKKAIACPICNKGISYTSDKDENYVWEMHFQNECTQQQQQKKLCPACKGKLTSLNSVQCQACGKEVCLKHRQQEDHSCEALRYCRSEEFKFLGIQQNAKQQYANTEPQQPPVSNSIQNNQQTCVANQGNGEEICPVCGKRFPYIMQLIRHSEIHSS